MRIAVSGSHRTGKTTLIEALVTALPEYESLEEPYLSMAAEGHGFSHPPSRDDFEAQLDRSIDDLDAGGENVLFDRCPVDLLAYLEVTGGDGERGLGRRLALVRDAMESLDLVAFVPVEAPDRIAFSPDADEEGTRLVVDERLRELLLDDGWDLGVEVVEVRGDPAARARILLERIAAAAR